MSERGDTIFTAEAVEAAVEFYEGLREFVIEQQQTLRQDERAEALLQLDPYQPYSPEMLTLMLLAVLRTPAREEFLEEFPPRSLPAPRVQRMVGAWLDGEIFLPDAAD